MNKLRLQWLLKPAVFMALSVPFLWLVHATIMGQLGPNPIETITDFTGEWALRILLLSLALTPLRMTLKKPWPIKLRRMVGLFSFFYVLLHWATYFFLDQQSDIRAIIDDLLERPYIMAGTLALVLLIPLVITSTNGMMKRLGKRWKVLHRLVYIAVTAAVVHYIWLTRGDQIEPLVYAFVLAVLMAFRLKKFIPKKRLPQTNK